MAEAVRTSYGIGEYVAGEAHLAITGRSTGPGAKRGVIIVGGFGATALNGLSIDAVGQGLLAAGVPQITCDLVDGKQWGNATMQARLTSAFNFAQARAGFKGDKVLLYLTSHGGSAMSWVRANLPKVAGVCTLIGAVDVKDIHDNARASGSGGTPAQMEGVHGGTAASFATAMQTLNPANTPADFAGIPFKAFTSSTDPIVIATKTAEFVAAVGASASQVNMGALGHAPDPAYAPQIVDFLTTYA